MDVDVRFPGGLVVEAETGGFTLRTDQPVEKGGAGSAPSPFQLFAVSLATCAGYYVLAFLAERGLPTEGLGLRLSTVAAPLGGVFVEVSIAIELPAGFPAKYHAAVERAAGHCLVKRQLEQPPRFVVHAVPAAAASASAA